MVIYVDFVKKAVVPRSVYFFWRLSDDQVRIMEEIKTLINGGEYVFIFKQ